MRKLLRLTWLAILLAWGGNSPLLGQLDTLTIAGPVHGIDLTPYFEVLVDSTDRMDLSAARQAESSRYRPLDSLSMPLPLTHRLWARATLRSRSPQSLKTLLFTSTSDSMAMYLFGGDSILHYRTGNYVPWRERVSQIGAPSWFPITFPPDTVLTVYVIMSERVGVGPDFHPRLYDYYRWMYQLLSSNYFVNILLILFAGSFMIMLLYNLIVFAATGTRSYLYYALYLFSILTALYFEMMLDRIPIFSFADYRLNRITGLLGLNGAVMFYLMFGRSFIETDRLTPQWDRVLKGLIVIRLIFALSGSIMIAGDWRGDLVLDASITWYGIESLTLLVYFVWLARSGSRVVWFFVVGSILVFGGGFMPVLMARQFGWALDAGQVLLPALMLEVLVFSLGLGYKMRNQQRDKLSAERVLNQELQKVNTAFGRFVPHEFIQSLGHESVIDVKLGDQVEKTVTVLFSDIRDYTTLAEDMTPAENFRFLNGYLGRMGPIIQQHGGFVNQYYGDGIMALFLNDPTDALQASVEMLCELQGYNADRENKGRQPIRIGVGLHTGPLMLGIIGDTLRMEASVVSDTVNTASRMEGLTKHFGVSLLLSDATRAAIQARAQKSDRTMPDASAAFGLRLLGNVLVKGRRRPLRVYECFDGDPPLQRDRKAATADEFEAGLQAYLRGDFARALRAWESVWQGLPGDPPTHHYVTLAQRYLTEGTPEHWDGVEVMLMK